LKLTHLLVPLMSLIFGVTFFCFIANADSGLNLALTELNAAARLDFGSYKADIGLRYNLSASKIDQLHLSLKMQPADIFMAAEISILCGKPIDRVVTVYQKHKSKGWGHIAKQLGIKPGSPEFKALKNKANSCSGKLKNKHNKNKYKYKKHK
jgi:hypothetical protein